MKKTIAIWMMMLMIIFPIQVAASLSNVHIYNKDYIESYRAQTSDRIIVTAHAELSGDQEITPDQLKIGNTEFTSCENTTELESGFNCEYIGALGSISDGNVKKHNLKVYLYDDNSIEKDDKLISLYIDNIGPNITLQDIRYDEGSLKVDYLLTDKACLDSTCAGCSGIGKIEILEGTTKYTELNINSSSCTYDNFSLINLTGSGLKSINVIATDRVGNSYTATKQIEVDANPPEIESFKLFRGGAELTHVSNAIEYQVELEVWIRDSNLSKITVDQIGLHYHPAAIRRNKSIMVTDNTCEIDQNLFKCKISATVASQDGTLKAQIYAWDTSGNLAEKELILTLQEDKIPPMVTFLGTGASHDGKNYIKTGENKFIIEMDEAGSGFNIDYNFGGARGKALVLDLSEISNLGKVAMYNCTTSGTKWTCFGVININNPKNGNLFIDVLNSFDDAGNRIDGIKTAIVKVDNDAPVQNWMQIFGQLYQQSVVSGDRLNILANVSDATPVKATAYLDNVIIDSTHEFTNDCVGDGSYLCGFANVGTIQPGPQENVDIKVRFTDLVGNYFENITKRNIVVEDDDDFPNHWGVVDVEAMPKTIDPDMAAQIAIPLFFKINLESFTPGAKPISQEISCGKFEDEKGFWAGPEIVYGQPTILRPSPTPYVRVILGRTNLKDTRGIKLNCTLTTVTETTNKLSKPETDSVLLEIGYSDLPLGTVSREMMNKMDEIVNDKFIKWSEKLAGLRKIYDILSKLCNMIGIYLKIVKTITGISKGFDILRTHPGGQVPANTMENINTAMAKGGHTMVGKIGKFCEILSCGKPGQGLWGGWYNKMNDQTRAALPGPFGGKTYRQDAKDPNKRVPDYSGMSYSILPHDPSENLYLSLMTGCLPGIIKGIERMKTIKCNHLQCIAKDYPQGLMDMATCDAVANYQECLVEGTWMFDLIPFSDFFKQIGNQLKAYFDSPVSLIFGIAGRLCTPVGNNKLSSSCVFARVLPMLAQIVDDLKGAKDFDLSLEDDTSNCDTLVEEIKSGNYGGTIHNTTGGSE